jgi:hypothetical protein
VSGDEIASLSTLDTIQQLAAADARLPLTTKSNILSYLQIWWSDYYSRPLKDPILQNYTFEELVYEYYAQSEYEKARKERIEQESDKIEKDNLQDAIDWADQMEADELQEQPMLSKQSEDIDPLQDPENIAWMEQQMRQAKELYGDNFGDDISEDFE